MAKYKLTGGPHVQRVPGSEPDKNTGRYPTQAFVKGEVIETDVDLIEKFPNKFELVSGKPNTVKSGALPPVQQASFPGGQVSSGFQNSTSLADGTTVSGPASAEKVAEIQAQGEKDRAKGEKAAATAVTPHTTGRR